MTVDRRQDDDIRKRLDEIDRGYKQKAKENRELIVHIRNLTVGAMAVVAVLLVAQGVASFLLRSNLSDVNSNRIADLATNQRAIAANQRAIQRSRAEAIKTACKEQNARNRVAYMFLKALPPSPGERQLSPAEKRSLIHGFTDAVVGPVRDCDERVRQLVH